MNREQAEQIARKFTDHLISISPNKRPSTNQLMVNAIIEAVAIEREECAKVCETEALRRTTSLAAMGARGCAEAIRARAMK